MAQVIQLHRTTSNNAPAAALPDGTLAVGIPTTNTRIWLGDGNVNRLLVSSDPLDAPITLATVAHNAAFIGTGRSDFALALSPAGRLDIATGTDNIRAITSSGLRTELGDTANNLNTNAKTIVPAINELEDIVRLLSNTLILAGGYDVAMDDVHPVTGIGAVAGPLPAPGPANQGWYVIVQVPGTGRGNAPPVAMTTGDWLISDGNEWLYFSMSLDDITADGVAITPIAGLNATNVQAALNELQVVKLDLVGADAYFLRNTGGILSGQVAMSVEPTLAAHLSTKRYVDLQDAMFIPLNGGVMTGSLSLSGPPTAALHAATKAYVDAHIPPFTGVIVDGLSIVGNGATIPISVNLVDGGEY